jgi:hypothetical protein
MLDRGRGPRLVLRAAVMIVIVVMAVVVVMAEVIVMPAKVVVVTTEVRAAAIEIISGKRTAPGNSSRDAKHRNSGK